MPDRPRFEESNFQGHQENTSGSICLLVINQSPEVPKRLIFEVCVCVHVCARVYMYVCVYGLMCVCMCTCICARSHSQVSWVALHLIFQTGSLTAPGVH